MKKLLLSLLVCFVFLLSPVVSKAQYQLEDIYTGNVYNINGYDSIYFKLDGRTLARLAESYTRFDGRFISKVSDTYIINDSLGLDSVVAQTTGIYRPISGHWASAVNRYWWQGYLGGVKPYLSMLYNNVKTGYTNTKTVEVDSISVRLLSDRNGRQQRVTLSNSQFKYTTPNLQTMFFVDSLFKAQLGRISDSTAYLVIDRSAVSSSLGITSQSDTNQSSTYWESDVTDAYWQNLVTNTHLTTNLYQYTDHWDFTGGTVNIKGDLYQLPPTLLAGDSILVRSSNQYGYILASALSVAHADSSDVAAFAWNADGIAMENIVSVDSNITEVVGRRYKSIADALSYIATQSPSSTNKWGVKVGGVNTENFTVPDNVVIIGEYNSTILNGTINGGALSTDAYKNMITNCIVSDINLTTGKMINLSFCTIYGFSAVTNTGVILNDCYVTGGDFSKCNLASIFIRTYFAGSVATPTKLPSTTEAFNCNFLPTATGGLYLYGGIFKESSLQALGRYEFGVSGTYYIKNCDMKANFSIDSSNIFNLYNCTGDNTSTITVGDGTTAGTLNTYGLAANLIIVTASGAWNEYGQIYDNRASQSTDTLMSIDNNIRGFVLASGLSVGYANLIDSTYCYEYLSADTVKACSPLVLDANRVYTNVYYANDSLLVKGTVTDLTPYSLILTDNYQLIGNQTISNPYTGGYMGTWMELYAPSFGRAIEITSQEKAKLSIISPYETYNCSGHTMFPAGHSIYTTLYDTVRSSNNTFSMSISPSYGITTASVTYGMASKYSNISIDTTNITNEVHGFVNYSTVTQDSSGVEINGVLTNEARVSTPGDTTGGIYYVTAGTGIKAGCLAFETIVVEGDGAAVNITANPQIPAGTNGQILRIYCTSDVNTITFENGTGLVIGAGGTLVLGAWDYAEFQYLDAASAWVLSNTQDN